MKFGLAAAVLFACLHRVEFWLAFIRRLEEAVLSTKQTLDIAKTKSEAFG